MFFGALILCAQYKIWLQKTIALCFIFLLVFTDLGNVFTFKVVPAIPHAEASLLPAIKVESFDQDVTSDGSTFTLTNDVGATSSAFIKLNTGTRKSSAGPTGSTGNTAPNVGTVGLVLTNTNEVTVHRADPTAVKVMGEVWRYEGPSGGSHEFIVRKRLSLSLTGTSASTAISGVSNVDKVIPFVTGYTVNDTSVSNWNAATIAAHMDDSGNLVVSRNNSGTAATVYVDVVEFTGSAWTVCHGYSASHDASDETVTLNTDSDGQGGSTCDVSDWGTATIIEATMEGDTAETGLSDTLAMVTPGANTTSVVFDFHQDSNAANDGAAYIHVLQNDDLVVHRASNADIAEGNGSYGTASWPAGASTAASLDSLSLEWFSDTSGVGTAHMRGGLYARITDAAGTIQHWIHRSGNTVGVEYGVVELAGLLYSDATTIVSTTGSQITDRAIPSSLTYLGGTIAVTELTASRNVINILLTESGTIDGSTGIGDIELRYEFDTSAPYDCASESYDGTESQYGSTDSNGFSGADGSSSFADSVAISPTQTLCVYPLIEVLDAAHDGETIELSINNPLTDVIVTNSGLVGPETPILIADTTNIRNAELTQVHYHWLNDDGVEGVATSIDGSEDTSAIGFAYGTTRRLRMQISAEGSTSSAATALRLEYASKSTTCDAATGWTDVGAGGGDWDMADSIYFVSDGLDSTDLAPASGGTTNENSTFLTPNGALKDTSSQTGSLTFSSSNFLELEYAIEPTATAPQGNTYCFRLTNAGTELRNYSVYPEGTISADIAVSATSSQIATVSAGSSNNYLGGAFVIQRSGGIRTVTDITISETGTIDGASNVTNVGLFYDLDTTAPYDCTGESYGGGETQFGSTDTDGFSAANGSSTFSGSETVNNTRSMCVYVVLDVGSGVMNGETINIEITNPSNDVVVTSSSVGPSTAVSPSGSTTVAAAVLEQQHYHWRNDDGSETGATSATGGFEDTSLSGLAKETTVRLRLGVSNKGTVTSNTIQYRLEYGTKIGTCAAISTWTDVGAVGGAWDMSLSANIADGNTTDVATGAFGAITNENSTFVGTGALRESSSLSGSITLSSTEFTELEYSIEATVDSGYGTTYCFRVTDNGSAVNAYIDYPEITTREKQDFYIQRGDETVSGTSLTLTAGVDYIAPASATGAFVRITNSQLTGAGNAVGTTNQNADDVTAYISDQSDITSSFTISRPATASNDTRVSWEIIEFVGLPGSDNEMIVRDVGQVSFTAATFTGLGGTVAGVTNDSAVVVFITGQMNNDASRNNYNDGLFTAAWNSGTQQPTFERADANVSATLGYAVVEFTGQNWSVQRVEHTYTAAGTTETENMSVIPSVGKAFIHAQKRVGTGLSGLDENGHQVWISSLGAISYQLRSGANTPSSHVSVAWVIANTQSGTGAMAVYHSNGTIPSGGTAGAADSLGIGETVNQENTSIFATNDSNGTGTAYPRVIAAYSIASSTNYEIWRSNTGQPIDFRVSVVSWPVADTALRQVNYRFYANNDQLTPSDPWPVGAENLGEVTEITAADDPVGEGELVRIRMSLKVSNATLPESTTAFKLQYGFMDTSCSAISTWTDVGGLGSGTIWRGYNIPVTDGTALATSTPAAGTLLLTGSNVAGTFEEENNSSVNPYPVYVNENIEYDWLIEHNGAAQRSNYCFRMVYADDSELAGYTYYPTLRTTGYTPIINTWRWYDDVSNETPSNPLAGELVAPIEISNQDVIKLRVLVSEVENAVGTNVKFALQYSQDPLFSAGGTYLVATSTCTATSTWCYADGAGIDNDLIQNSVLLASDPCTAGSGVGCGTHNEAATTSSLLTQPASSNMEFEYTLRQAAARVNGVYYFRLIDVATDQPLIASSSYPSLLTEGAQLVFSVNGLSAGVTTAGETIDATSTSNQINFGHILPNETLETGQQISVVTNATEGYQVFLFSDGDLTDAYGNVIEAITSTNETPASWSTTCSGTQSCIGYHSTDAVLADGSTRFAPLDSYAALDTVPKEVMSATFPTNDQHDIVYKLFVSDQQDAGNYLTNLTYIAVPVF